MADLNAIGSLLGGIGSIGSTIAGAFQASANRKFQAQEAQKQRDFNHNEAELSRMYNTQMVNAQNRYNSPAALAQRYKDAGMNPALAMSGGQLGSVGVGSTSQQASSGASPSGAQSDFSALANIGLVMEQGRLLAEQVKGTKIDNELKKKDLNNKDREQDDAHNLASAMTNDYLMSASVKSEQVNEIAQKVVNLQKQWELTDKQVDAQELENALNESAFQYKLSEIQSQAGISHKTFIYFEKQLCSLLALQSAQANQANASARQSNALARWSEMDNEMREAAFEAEKQGYVRKVDIDNNKYVQWTEKGIQLFGDLLGSISQVVSLGGALRSLGK